MSREAKRKKISFWNFFQQTFVFLFCFILGSFKMHFFSLLMKQAQKKNKQKKMQFSKN
jgi:hypothetical protein